MQIFAKKTCAILFIVCTPGTVNVGGEFLERKCSANYIAISHAMRHLKSGARRNKVGTGIWTNVYSKNGIWVTETGNHKPKAMVLGKGFEKIWENNRLDKGMWAKYGLENGIFNLPTPPLRPSKNFTKPLPSISNNDFTSD